MYIFQYRGIKYIFGEYINMLHEKQSKVLEGQKNSTSAANIVISTGRTLYSGCIKTLLFPIKWAQNCPIALKEKNLGVLKTLHDLDLTPHDIVTFRFVTSMTALSVYALVSDETFMLHKEAGVPLYIASTILDALDGTYARKYKMTSPDGEKYDAGTDKIIVMLADFVALSQISDPILFKTAFASFVVNWGYLIHSFRQRGPILEQLNLFKNLAIGIVKSPYEEKVTKNAANIFGKLKTIFQMIANSGLLVSGTASAQILLDQTGKNVFQGGFIALSVGAISLSILSSAKRKGTQDKA